MNKTGLDDFLLEHSASDLDDLSRVDMVGLKAGIRKIAQSPAFDKKRGIGRLVQDELEKIGRFYRTDDERLFFFHSEGKQLYDIGKRPFHYLVTNISGLASTEDFYRFFMDTLAADTSTNGKLAEVHTIAAYKPHKNILAISDGGGSVWFLEDGRWTLRDNGHRGVLFLKDPDSEPFEPDFSGDGSDLKWLVDQYHFAGTEERVQDQRTLLRIWMTFVFFKSDHPTRPIPAFLGPKGSGKSTACRLIGRLFVGPRFNVSGIRTDKEDAFIASVTSRAIYSIDNADDRVKWLEDALARHATGEVFRLRSYYSTNDEVSFRPTALVLLNSRDPKFRRADVAERLLPFNMERLVEFRPEAPIFNEVNKRRSRILGDLMNSAAEAFSALKKVAPPELPFRMADFASFGWRIFKRRNREKEWKAILRRLEKVQSDFADEDSFIEVMKETLATGIKGPITTGDLFKECKSIAESLGLDFPNNAAAFGRKFRENQKTIELETGIRITHTSIHGGIIRVSFIQND
jgi:hypothetical protein